MLGKTAWLVRTSKKKRRQRASITDKNFYFILGRVREMSKITKHRKILENLFFLFSLSPPVISSALSKRPKRRGRQGAGPSGLMPLLSAQNDEPGS